MTLVICNLGSPVTVRGTLTEEDGTVVTGATVTAEALAPGSSTPTALGAASDDGDGVYSVTFEPDTSGHWLVRFESASPSKAASPDGLVVVRETRFA